MADARAISMVLRAALEVTASGTRSFRDSGRHWAFIGHEREDHRYGLAPRVAANFSFAWLWG